jgi:hypothetical protein
MPKILKTYEFFKHFPIDVTFSLPEIADNPSHPQYVHLMEDLKSISKDELLNFNDKHKGRYNQTSPENEIRMDFLIETIQNKLAAERQFHYGHPSNDNYLFENGNLKHLDWEENSLVAARHFNFLGNGLVYEGLIYRMAPATAVSNSSYWITSAINNLMNEKGYHFKIRLDPCFKIPLEDYQEIGLKMVMYSKPLDWDRIQNLKSEETGQFKSEYVSSRTEFTDYTWRPEGDEVHFTCEELPIKDDLNIRGSRYFHAIFDKKSGSIKHCDGAVRIYNAEEFKYRIKYHVSKPEVRKIGKRAKIFQCDDEITQHDFVLLVNNFMVWNDDVIKYFSL